MNQGLQPESKFVALDGGRFHYLDWGGAGPPLICLHGAGGNAGNWSPLAAALGRELRVIGLDQRGHGKTEAKGIETLPLLAGDLFMFCRALGLAKFHLLGHSMGARGAAAFAAMHPGRVEKLVLSDPPKYDMEDELAQQLAELDARPQGFRDERALVEAMAETLGVMAPYWPKIKSATLLLHGTRSEALSPQAAKEIAQRVSACTLVEIEAGHGIFRENQEAAIAATRKFLLG